MIWDNCKTEETNAIESVQLEAAHIITGLRKGISDKLYIINLGGNRYVINAEMVN